MPVAESCEFGANRCKNSDTLVGPVRGKCCLCRLAPGTRTLGWNAVLDCLNGSKQRTHPVLEHEKALARMKKSRDAQQTRLKKDRGKKKVLKRAEKAEQVTGKHLNVTATKNSGRSNKDGDHVAAGFITLDTKFQSQRENPVVLLSELTKVRQDATRAKMSIGGLVLRNQHGVGVVVFDETDFARVLGYLTEKDS